MSQDQLAQDAIELHTAESEVELTNLVQQLLDEAKRQGATQAEASVGDSIAIEVSARSRNIENVSFEQNRAFHITVYVNKREGVAVTSDTSGDAIRDTVTQAISIANYTAEDPCNGLADQDRLATTFLDLDQNHPKQVDIDDLKTRALAADAATLDYDECIQPSYGADASMSATCSVRGNSHGFLRSARHTSYGISATAIAQSDAGMQSDYWYDQNCRSSLVQAPDEVGREAARRAKRRLDPQTIATGSYPVLYDAYIAPAFISELLAGISGGSLYRDETYLVDSLGQEVAAKSLTLREYPHLIGRMYSRNFDTDAVQTNEKTIVANGVVETYLLGTYSGRRLKMASTGNAGGTSNVHVETEFTPISSVIGDIQQGLLVTSLIGSGTNLVTGDYSCGAAGFWIENGEITHPVDNVTIASNLDTMFKGIAAFGDDIQDRTSLRTGSVLVEEMTVASNA